MKKLRNTQGELKKGLLIKKAYSMKLKIFIFSPVYSSYHHTEYHPEQYVPSDHSASASLEMGEGVNKKSNKKALKGERAVKKVISLTQILLCTFFSNSIFPSWFPMTFRQYYSERQKEHIQERAYQCI